MGPEARGGMVGAAIPPVCELTPAAVAPICAGGNLEATRGHLVVAADVAAAEDNVQRALQE